MTTKTFTTTIHRDGGMCFLPLPFDPRPVFGKVRAPVTVTVNGYAYRSTIASMGAGPCIPLRRSHREAAGLRGDETLAVTLALDTAPRTVDVPDDLAAALAADPRASAAWNALGYSHHREHVDALAAAKKPETRARRLAATLARLAAERADSPAACGPTDAP